MGFWETHCGLDETRYTHSPYGQNTYGVCQAPVTTSVSHRQTVMLILNEMSYTTFVIISSLWKTLVTECAHAELNPHPVAE